MSLKRQFVDIAANLTDAMYSGIYNGSKKHESDLTNVLKRAWAGGLDKIIVTGGDLKGSIEAVRISQSDDHLYCTVGCHPTRCSEFDENNPSSYLQSLEDVVSKNKDKVVAIGECGLDYDRIQFCPKETQKKYFELQLKLVEKSKLPLFLHCRNAHADLIEILTRHKDSLYGGVVHSFDGTLEEAKEVLNLGYYIGINGCSLKTAENLEVVKQLPKDRLLLETDCPYCEVRPSHASSRYVETTFTSVKKEKWNTENMIKGRNEPVTIVQILEVISAVRGEDLDNLCETIFTNTHKLFFPKNKFI